MPKVTAEVVSFTSVPGPRGAIHVAASPRGVVAIDLLTPTDEFAAELKRRFGRPGRFVPARATDGRLGAAVDALDRFLDGDRAAFDTLALDLVDRPAWDRAVLGAVRAIPWGATSSYGGVAAAIGRRGAARAVGGAVGRNPISLAIPCHRVIAGDGTLGGYGGGWWGSRELRLDLKRELLAREGTFIGDSAIVAQATRGTPPPR